jgi:hypothetical protein
MTGGTARRQGVVVQLVVAFELFNRAQRPTRCWCRSRRISTHAPEESDLNARSLREHRIAEFRERLLRIERAASM